MAWLVEYRGDRGPRYALHYESDRSGKRPLLTASEERLAEGRWIDVPDGVTIDVALRLVKLGALAQKYAHG